MIIDILKNKEQELIRESVLSKEQLKSAEKLLTHEDWVILSQSAMFINIQIATKNERRAIKIKVEDGQVNQYEDQKVIEWDEFGFAALRIYIDNADWKQKNESGQIYTREGMINRVLEERKDKARKANYRIKLGKSIYGEHILINEKRQKFKITLWDLDQKTGYVDNIDWNTNKLCTTKHIMYVYEYLDKHKKKVKKLSKSYPFIEISLDPLSNYEIHWRFPDSLTKEEKKLLDSYFGNKTHLIEADIVKFIPFLSKAVAYQRIKIRPEVLDKIERYINKMSAAQILNDHILDYSLLKIPLFPYQKTGVNFVLPKTGAIIADEMGLGKTAQAIASIVFKHQLFGFSKSLVICPASLKYQWKNEIEKFSHLKASVVEGFPDERKIQYLSNDFDVYIINYERVLRDLNAINEAKFQYVVLDEAQKIKNFNTKTAVSIKKINREHSLVITGTPLENKIGDLYSILQFVDPFKFTPLWEFSYQYCVFSSLQKDKILGYYNIPNLKERLKDLLIRREKRKVLDDLPQVIQKDVYINLHPAQEDYHLSFSKSIAQILAKKFKTPFDYQRIMLLLNSMRMSCDSTYLVDKETFHSSKLDELQHILVNRLDLKNSKRKVIIFSEWINMLNLIGDQLKAIGLDFVMLTGKVPVKKRGELIRVFEDEDTCRVFLSTESGGAGLNLQAADILINFELPWNPAKKNQRIGRIDRLGQTANKLTIINLITKNTIEEKIMTGLLLKQNLFDGVLNESSDIEEVDLSEKGRADFLRNLQDALNNMEDNTIQEDDGHIWEDLDELEEAVRVVDEEHEPVQIDNVIEQQQKYENLENVLEKGMDFLAGIYEMSSGKKLTTQGEKSIKVDRETGEVTMKFKVNI